MPAVQRGDDLPDHRWPRGATCANTLGLPDPWMRDATRPSTMWAFPRRPTISARCDFERETLGEDFMDLVTATELPPPTRFCSRFG